MNIFEPLKKYIRMKARMMEVAKLNEKMRQHGNRSKYMPHQGKQECARRIRQGAA